MKTIIISYLTACSKIITSFKECGIEFEIINTEIDKSYETVPDYPEKIDVLGNVYQNKRWKFLKLFRFCLGIPFIAWVAGKFWTSIKSIKYPSDVEFIFANWGSGIIPELNLLKESKELPAVKSILNLESFPTSWNNKFREIIEIFLLRCSLKNIDALIIPTDRMHTFLKEKVPTIKNKSCLISPYYFPASFYKKDEGLSKPTKDLIFLGQINSSRILNNVTNQIITLAENDIKISTVENRELNITNISFFPPFKSSFLKEGKLHKLAKDHKAALVTYYLPPEDKIPTRYSTSLPHRFLMPLALGIPIVLPKNYFLSMEEIISKNEIGLAYSSIDELKNFLAGDDWKIAKENLKKNHQKFLFDQKKFLDFFNSLLQ